MNTTKDTCPADARVQARRAKGVTLSGERMEGVSIIARKRPARPWMKGIALTIIFTFLFEQIFFGQEVRPPVVQPISSSGFDIKEVSIPRDVAIVKDVTSTASKEMVINIKDVHDNFGAQESIVSVLDNLLTNYDIRFIGMEGSEGYIDMSMISAFPDEEAKKTTAGYLMREGRISAGEFFAALSGTPVMTYGIENSELYLRNYKAFLLIEEQKEENLRIVDIFRKILCDIEPDICSEDLLVLNGNSVLNNNNGLKFTERWRKVSEIGAKNGVKYDDYPNVNALIGAVEAEKEINYEATNNERDAVLDILARILPRAPMEELVLKSLSFKLGRISKSQFYSYILMLAKAQGIDGREYVELERFCDYVSLYESIDLAGLMDEIDDYEMRVKEKIFRTDSERKLTRLLKDVEIMHNMFDIKLTSGQLKYYRDNKKNFEWKPVMEFVREQLRKRGKPIPAELSRVGEIYARVPEAGEFYAAATDRNEAMVKNTIARMKENNVTVGVMVTGGFHTRGISDILKSQGTSYMVLLPRFNSRTGKRPYITILTNKTNEYKHYTASGEYLAVTSNFAVMKDIIRGSGMEDPAFRMRLQTVAMLLAITIVNYVSKGVVNTEVWDRIKDRYLHGYTAAQDRLVDEKIITAAEKKESVEFMQEVLESVVIRAEEGQATVLFATGTEDNLGYRIKLKTDNVEGREEKNLVVEAYDRVSSKVIEQFKLEQSLSAAQKTGEEAAAAAQALISSVQTMKEKELNARIEQYLMGRGGEADIEKQKRDVASIAGRLGIKLSDEKVEDLIKVAIAKAADDETKNQVEGPGAAAKRAGTDEDTGEKARRLAARQQEFKGLTPLEGYMIDDVDVVVEADLGDAAAAYQFTDTSTGKTYIVLSTNEEFISFREEAIMHEMREVFWLKRKRELLESIAQRTGMTIERIAHIMASMETSMNIGRRYSEEPQLTPYHLSELDRMDAGQLNEILNEVDESGRREVYLYIYQALAQELKGKGTDEAAAYYQDAAAYEEIFREKARSKLSEKREAEEAARIEAERQADAVAALKGRISAIEMSEEDKIRAMAEVLGIRTERMTLEEVEDRVTDLIEGGRLTITDLAAARARLYRIWNNMLSRGLEFGDVAKVRIMLATLEGIASDLEARLGEKDLLMSQKMLLAELKDSIDLNSEAEEVMIREMEAERAAQKMSEEDAARRRSEAGVDFWDPLGVLAGFGYTEEELVEKALALWRKATGETLEDQPAHVPEVLMSLIKEGQVVFMVDKEGNIVGFLSFGMIGNEAIIDKLAVDEAAKGMDGGTIMMDLAMKKIAEKGLREFSLIPIGTSAGFYRKYFARRRGALRITVDNDHQFKGVIENADLIITPEIRTVDEELAREARERAEAELEAERKAQSAKREAERAAEVKKAEELEAKRLE
ncbi:MAG: GNAT family N-acetyltransferase, partial [Candidatus Omnitrophica bacterium]|nr:GNAT family N-acetyltransferase [Candidatus Omnitrophota bacterium]